MPEEVKVNLTALVEKGLADEVSKNPLRFVLSESACELLALPVITTE